MDEDDNGKSRLERVKYSFIRCDLAHLGSISRIRKWWAELIFDVMVKVSDGRWGHFVTLVVVHAQIKKIGLL